MFKQTVLNPGSAIAHLSRQNLFSPLPLSRVASNSAVIANASILYFFLSSTFRHTTPIIASSRNVETKTIERDSLSPLWPASRAVTPRKTARKDGGRSDIELTFNCEFLQLLYDLQRRSKLRSSMRKMMKLWFFTRHGTE